MSDMITGVPYYQDDHITVHHGDCITVMAELDANSVDAIVTDPPYGLEFMGKDWDSFKTSNVGNPSMAAKRKMDTAAEPEKGNPWASERKSYGAVRKVARCMKCGKQKFNHENSRCHCPEPLWDYGQRESMHTFQAWCTAWAEQCLRVLKPGGHMLAFGGTRTWHRLTSAIEDAGFEIRDSIAWLYGSGFPKSRDVSKAIDSEAGAEREITSLARTPWKGSDASVTGVHGEAYRPTGDDGYVTKPITAPATPEAAQWAGWGTALKPAHEPIVVARKPLTGTVANNVLAWGTGAINIDGCRIGTSDKWEASGVQSAPGSSLAGSVDGSLNRSVSTTHEAGRWPANVILDEHTAAELDQQSGIVKNPYANKVGPMERQRNNGVGLGDDGLRHGSSGAPESYGDSGGASKFMYTAKADQGERITHNGTTHPTVKPLDLMRWLVRLVTPPGGTVLEPFAGSGTTAEAALLEGFRCIAIEREADYLPLITQRIHRRRDPVAYLTEGGHDLGLFGDDI